VLHEKLAESGFTFGERRACNLASELHTMLLGDFVQYGNRRAIAQEYSLGVDRYGIVHYPPGTGLRMRRAKPAQDYNIGNFAQTSVQSLRDARAPDLASEVEGG
jgi:hypothetical protein